jgi:hypothetical protein
MPFFDEKGNMIDADKVNLDDDFPKLQDLDKLPKMKGKKLFSLPDTIFTTTTVLASIVIALLVVIVAPTLKINSLKKEAAPLSKEYKQLGAPQTEYDKLDARVRKLEETAKRKPQLVTVSKKPNDQKKKQVR